ncbi:DMT family transporter [uncultured Erythrobacter sp.]|uniref:DMT family transporter n=1 Tax=uncultured Erythrobacter sp. TaxID=263913 RepID=UPI00263A29A5|nr:DMT family transporter [uncultured Erythrobacter sp.]
MSRSLSSAPWLPFAAALAGVGFLSMMDAFMKEAALTTGTYTATVLRSLIGAAIIAPVWLWKRTGWPDRPTMKLHLERGIISAIMALSFFYSLTKLPLAEAIAISFVAPLIALYLARILLGEEIHAKAIFASLLGFAGTLVIISGKIGQGNFDDDVALGLAALLFSAMLYAYNFIVIRKQSQLAGPVEVATFHSGVGGIVLLALAPFLATPIETEALVPLVSAGMLTVLGAMSLAWAYARAEAQALVPIEYSGFIWASVLGWAFFRETVTVPTLAGTLLIVTGCWLATRKGQTGKAEAAQT